ncbi:MAG: polysaccharide biosynthesis/export family protein [Planctomycetales bacterium]|nr:polysaccharide biosynthesis/export family protein [Planctomycetales bacterium]
MPHALVASPAWWRHARCCAVALTCTLCGCKLWQGTSAETNGPGLAWLSNLVGQPVEPTVPQDFAWLKPEPRTSGVFPGDELEVTVHDLFEVGKPHTWTSLVTPSGQLDVPLLGRVVVAGGDPLQIAEALADRYRAGDILLEPRVQVRQLNQPTVSVRVEGEVHHAETVQLSRVEANLHRALVATGGPKSSAGTHVSIKRRVVHVPGENSERQVAESSAIESSNVGAHDVVWFDADRDADRKALRDWRLADGDVVTVHLAASPVRIAGDVSRPGTIKLPAGRQQTVWEVLQLAGGTAHPDAPSTVTLIRPAKDVHGPQRWSFPVNSGDESDLGRFPIVEPGDTIHVAVPPTKRSRRHAKDHASDESSPPVASTTNSEGGG